MNLDMLTPEERADFNVGKLSGRLRADVTPAFDALYDAYELYLVNRLPGDPFFTFSGWLQNPTWFEKELKAYQQLVNTPLGPMQMKCMAGPQNAQAVAENIYHKELADVLAYVVRY